MEPSTDQETKSFIIDTIHSDIRLSPEEIKVIDTPVLVQRELDKSTFCFETFLALGK
jgi:hypothetical protein